MAHLVMYIKINEGGIVPTGSFRASISIIIIIIIQLRFFAPGICHLPVTNGHLTHLLSSVLSAQHKRKALHALKGNHAQLMLDFLDLVSEKWSLLTRCLPFLLRQFATLTCKALSIKTGGIDHYFGSLKNLAYFPSLTY